MGEYYQWVNVDRKEYIRPSDFDLGSKSHESMWREGNFLCALRELLFEEWSGCHVFWMGDEKLIPEDSGNETLRILYEDSVKFGYPEDGFDTVCESYRNVSCLFKTAEKSVRESISDYIEDLRQGIFDSPYNEYGIDIEHPYERLFLRNGRAFRYTINHSKRICYAFGETKILYKNGEETDYHDPLPILMGYGRVLEDGSWLGDVIGVADDMPEGYELLKEVYLDW